MDKSSETVSMNLFRVFDRAGRLLYIGLIHGGGLKRKQVDHAIVQHINQKRWVAEIGTIRTQQLIGTYGDAVTTQISCEMTELPKYGMSYRSMIKEASKPEVWPWGKQSGWLN